MLHLIGIGVSEMAGTATLMYIGCSAGGLGIHHNYTRDYTTLQPPSNTTAQDVTFETGMTPLPFALKPKFPLPGIDLCLGTFWGFAVFVAVQVLYPFLFGDLFVSVQLFIFSRYPDICRIFTYQAVLHEFFVPSLPHISVSKL